MPKPTSKQLGNALEDIVAAIHDLPGVSVTSRVQLPVLGSESGRTREIDVLVSSDVAGYPVRIAIECKNEKEPVGTERIDQFVGKLADVGIPNQHGIFVSPVGFTAPGLERARMAGIRPLNLEGLNAERLGGAISEALESFVYFVAEIRGYDRFTDHPEIAPTALDPQQAVLPRHGQGLSGVNMYVWERWITGDLQIAPGEQFLFVQVPKGFRFGPNDQASEAGTVIVTLNVTAHVAHIPGTATRFQLRHASTGVVEKILLEATFPHQNGPLSLSTMANAQDLEAYRGSLQAEHVIAHDIRVPRIVSGALFWPPSNEAVARVQELRLRGDPITFANVEGADLSRAWEGFVVFNDT